MRVAAPRSRQIEKRQPCEQAEKARAGSPHRLAVSVERRPERLADRCLPGIPGRGGVIASHRGLKDAGGIGHFDRGGDDSVEEDLLDLPAAIKFHQSVVRATRGRDRITVYGGQDLAQLSAALGGLGEPSGQHRVAVGRSLRRAC